MLQFTFSATTYNYMWATTCGLFIKWNDVLPNEAPRLRAEGFLTCFTELEKTMGAGRVGVTTITTLRFLLVQYFVVVREKYMFRNRFEKTGILTIH